MNNDFCTIKILPHGRTIQAQRGTRLLEVLIGDNILLRSDCGGKGVCGKCNVVIIAEGRRLKPTPACILHVQEDISIEIPEASLLSSHIMTKAPISLPLSFISTRPSSPEHGIGIAVDLGTTTIAIYCCDIASREVLSSLAMKNPQALYGDDVMSRIDKAGQSNEQLYRLQQLVIRAIDWGVGKLFNHNTVDPDDLERMVVVGNPTMIHLLLGEDPSSIGISPYLPAFFSARTTKATELGLSFPRAVLYTLPQVSGFIGGDILAATLATELVDKPIGTLLIDLGTNGELILKGRDGFYATSCATGPAFEGAALACGMQAIPGAIDRVILSAGDAPPQYSLVQKQTGKPSVAAGICGSGVISAVAALIAAGIVDKTGRFASPSRASAQMKTVDGSQHYVFAPAAADMGDISLSQKDIRSVQLGKSALISGIEFLLRAAGMTTPERILIAGAFGSHLDKDDMLAVGMLPCIDPTRIEVVGNAAGAGAVMIVCNSAYLDTIRDLVEETKVIDLTADSDFQKTFIEQLSFPAPAGKQAL